MRSKLLSLLWWQKISAALLLTTLAGCGGSSSSSNPTSTPVANSMAVITQSNFGSGNLGFTISIQPSGVANYTKSTAVTPPTNPPTETSQSGTGTIPSALASQLFQDLATATPLQNLPASTGMGGTILSSSTSVQFQGQKGYIDNPGDAREQALEADVAAIAKALGLPQY